jgi:riboflavin synthase
MFTGIVESMGSVSKLTRHGMDAVLDIDTPMSLDDVGIGDSVAINGACLTVTKKRSQGFTADVSAETLQRTNLRVLNSGDPVNLEKALRLNSFLGGHLVLGHVDALGKIFEKTTRSSSVILGVEADADICRFIVEKGSVTLDGVSLTVNSCEKTRFYVNVIPHTARMTTLGLKKTADWINIETDIIGKYVEKLLKPGKGIDMDLLAKHGFINP